MEAGKQWINGYMVKLHFIADWFAFFRSDFTQFLPLFYFLVDFFKSDFTNFSKFVFSGIVWRFMQTYGAAEPKATMNMVSNSNCS